MALKPLLKKTDFTSSFVPACLCGGMYASFGPHAYAHQVSGYYPDLQLVSETGLTICTSKLSMKQLALLPTPQTCQWNSWPYYLHLKHVNKTASLTKLLLNLKQVSETALLRYDLHPKHVCETASLTKALLHPKHVRETASLTKILLHLKHVRETASLTKIL